MALIFTENFLPLVEGWQILAYTDHKPLTYALLTSSDNYTVRQICHLDYISQFTLDICHVKSAQNGLVDALSHLYENALHVELNVIIDFEKLGALQENDPELVQLKSFPSSLIPWIPGKSLCE